MSVIFPLAKHWSTKAENFEGTYRVYLRWVAHDSRVSIGVTLAELGSSKFK